MGRENHFLYFKFLKRVLYLCHALLVQYMIFARLILIVEIVII